MTKTKIKKVKKTEFVPISPFKTLEEEADFWDTHSMVDHIDDGTLVGFHVGKKSKVIAVRFPEEHHAGTSKKGI